MTLRTSVRTTAKIFRLTIIYTITISQFKNTLTLTTIILIITNAFITLLMASCNTNLKIFSNSFNRINQRKNHFLIFFNLCKTNNLIMKNQNKYSMNHGILSKEIINFDKNSTNNFVYNNFLLVYNYLYIQYNYLNLYLDTDNKFM